MKKLYICTVQSDSTLINQTGAESVAGSIAKFVRLRLNLALTISIILLFLSFAGQAQNCPTSGTSLMVTNENTYYPGKQATVAAGATSITVGAVTSGYGTTAIATGDIVLIIQMQGATLTIPATASSSFYGANVSGQGYGFMAANISAGLMEFAVASNAVPLAGGTLNIASGLTNAYSYAAYGTNGQYTYQIIRVSTHYNIQLNTSTITTPTWNGSIGGVSVFSAVNQFDFNGKTISAQATGFRGGGGRILNGQSGLNKNDFYGPSTNNAHGSKGEGAAGTPRYMNYNNVLLDNVAEGYPGGSSARGAPGNAGGGASDSDPTSNDQNAGGGGGGNGGYGGLGGNGWYSYGATGGRGGTPLVSFAPYTTYYSPARLIMGGGGGAGTTNNGSGLPGGGLASSGSAGGGLVIINANLIIGTGTINASAGPSNNTTTIDGSGGGGAGGSILIYANSGQSGVTAIANGGNGSSNNPAGLSASQHGPGGGGGGGMIFSNLSLNGASTVTQGTAGISIGTSATSSYGAIDGSVGILTQTFPFAQLPPKMQICQSIVLPVTLLSFSASYESANNVKVAWTTTDEVNADYFEAERSSNGMDFSSIGQVSVSNSLNPIHSYTLNDQLANVNSDIVYYRLRIVDLSGKFTYSKVVPVKLGQPENVISVYPNPVDSYTILNIYSDKTASGALRVIDNSGKQITTKTFNASNGNNRIVIDQLGYLPKGMYVLQVMFDNKLYNQKIIKR